MSLRSYVRSEKRKHINSKLWKEFMFQVDWYWDKWVLNPWNYISYTIWERIRRSWDYAKHGWLSYDFDAYYIHETVLFNLKRLNNCFINHGHHSEDCENYKPKMKSIKLAIKYLSRYCEPYNPYYDSSMDAHNKKWGELEDSTTPSCVDPDGYVRTYSWNTWRKNANTEEEKKQERLEFSKAYEADAQRQERDLSLAYEIIAKYHRYWWD